MSHHYDHYFTQNQKLVKIKERLCKRLLQQVMTGVSPECRARVVLMMAEEDFYHDDYYNIGRDNAYDYIINKNLIIIDLEV